MARFRANATSVETFDKSQATIGVKPLNAFRVAIYVRQMNENNEIAATHVWHSLALGFA
jgi:hypothetical protein